ncbi:hypothetical protein GCM10025867_16930 [Frondihabitans sucicola]|uniref:Uncharacterized protein n=1 Tax=Frondihabitans sucicola TaxID=1268041 RepID=A0ABM8GM09_9MICO|nr:hypothetical protein GCM10025867_16930 [Frondihabitans sucicola]
MLLDRGDCEVEARRDALIGVPLRHERQHLDLARRQGRQRVVPSGQQVADDLLVDDRAARDDPFDGVLKLVERRHPVFQQVADPRGPRVEEVGRVVGLRVLAEQQDSDGRVRALDRDTGPDALVSEGRRHPDVEDGEVGFGRAEIGHQRLGVAVGADDVVARLLEETGDTLAEENGVVGQDDARNAGSHDLSVRAAGLPAPPRSPGEGDRDPARTALR